MKKILQYACILGSITYLSMSIFPIQDHAYADNYSIILDGICLRNIQYLFDSTCPTYPEINLLFPGTVCGFPGSGCLDYYRQTDPSGHRYWIDPPGPILERTKIIEIRSDFKEYLNPTFQGYNKTEHSIIYGVGRYVDDCHHAYIDSEQWVNLLGDTIMYLASDCTKTNLITDRVEQLEKVNHDITTSYKYQLEQWQKESKIKCKEVCKEY